jgi:hypothetical protein
MKKEEKQQQQQGDKSKVEDTEGKVGLNKEKVAASNKSSPTISHRSRKDSPKSKLMMTSAYHEEVEESTPSSTVNKVAKKAPYDEGEDKKAKRAIRRKKRINESQELIYQENSPTKITATSMPSQMVDDVKYDDSNTVDSTDSSAKPGAFRECQLYTGGIVIDEFTVDTTTPSEVPHSNPPRDEDNGYCSLSGSQAGRK